MPKQRQSESVLHDWVHKLPFQMQALLLTGMRGPDATEKHNTAKIIVRYLRGVVCKPAGDWSGKNNNDFMWGEYSRSISMLVVSGKQDHAGTFETFRNHVDEFWKDHDKYPHHFIMHLVHCAEVVGYKHPNKKISGEWKRFYMSACESFHMTPETEQDMDARLNDFGEGVHNKKKSHAK